VWRSVSSGLTGAVAGQELLKDERFDEKRAMNIVKTKQLTPLEVIVTTMTFRKGISNAY
jgi:hypothetical protein